MTVSEETLRRYVEGFVPTRLLSGESGAITALDALVAELRAVRVDNKRLREQVKLADENLCEYAAERSRGGAANKDFLDRCAAAARFHTTDALSAAPGEDA